MTTEVFSDAHVKIYLDASVEERAKRRHREEERRGSGKTFDMICDEIRTRDAVDKGHAVGKLRVAQDAHVVDNSAFSVDETVAHCIELCERLGVKKAM
jgi:cytidylate kinase